MNENSNRLCKKKFIKFSGHKKMTKVIGNIKINEILNNFKIFS
jgi:hypothetical protein